VTASLATHDDAIGRLVGNVNTVAATVSSRDQQIKTVLDNLVAISTTFSANTTIVDDAVTNLGTVSANLDRLLSANRDQIDHILANVNTVLNVVVGRLPQINDTLNHFPNASRSLLALGNVGQFLALTAPCLSVQLLPGVDAAIPCNTPLNNPLTPAAPAAQSAPAPGAGAHPATGAKAATATAAPTTTSPAAAVTTGLSDFLTAIGNAGATPAGS
jgi:ABC-type transporter Mla subunit MlaD